MLRFYERGSSDYTSVLRSLERRGDADLERVTPDVRAILDRVRAGGDAALVELTRTFEKRELTAVRLPDDIWRAEAERAPADVQKMLRAAADRIRRYHEHQREPGFGFTDSEGIELGLRVSPVKAAGVYAPGGKARYPSTVLMTAVPASVAGVRRIVLATPRPTPEILAAAAIAGVTEVVDLGGAQAIGALAYGTESVGRVDKIVGPGNLYVACAKKMVFGLVDIDSIAGPSEILVVADEGANPEVVAADLLSQAEHDEDAYPLLVTTTRAVAEAVDAALVRQLAALPREAIARESVVRHGHCFIAGDLVEAARVADALASEHLALSVADPDSMLPSIHAAGAIFLGYHTPEAAGDYAAGPSHVLPTGGAARFSSPLGVWDFVVRTSMIRYSREAIVAQAELLEGLARLEGLEAHARAVSERRK